MVITQTPFRMSFFGGGTDFKDYYKEYGGAVLSTTIDKYCYVTVRHLPHFFEHNSEAVYSIIERVNSADEIKHPSIREAMKWLDMREIRLVYDFDVPARSGLGSSSAFAVSMLNAFYALKGRYADKHKLAKDAIFLERNLCKETGGEQDQIAVSFGGFNRIEFKEDGYSVAPVVMSRQRKKELNENLLMYFTGVRRFSSDIQNDTKMRLKDNKSQLHEMKQMVYEAEKILADGKNLKDFGKLLDNEWKLKKSLSKQISADSIDEIYSQAVKAGAEGGKLLGAGGGGYFVFYVEKELQKIFKERMKELLHIPFEFENAGTRVLYYQAEDYEIGRDEK